jgi:hypothetical protein
MKSIAFRAYPFTHENKFSITRPKSDNQPNIRASESEF